MQVGAKPSARGFSGILWLKRRFGASPVSEGYKNFPVDGSTDHKSKTKPSLTQGEVVRAVCNPKQR